MDEIYNKKYKVLAFFNGESATISKLLFLNPYFLQELSTKESRLKLDWIAHIWYVCVNVSHLNRMPQFQSVQFIIRMKTASCSMKAITIIRGWFSHLEFVWWANCQGASKSPCNTLIAWWCRIIKATLLTIHTLRKLYTKCLIFHAECEKYNNAWNVCSKCQSWMVNVYGDTFL